MTSSPHRFTAAAEELVWGGTTYTVIRVPAALAADAATEGTRRVAGTMDGVEVNVGLNRAPVLDDPYVYAGPVLLRRVRAEVGEPLRCELRPVDPDLVPVPDDVAAALAGAGMADPWEALRPAARRRLLQPVVEAVRPDTRARRVARLVRELGGGSP